MSNQGNKVAQKEIEKSPETKPQATEHSDFNGREFKSAIWKAQWDPRKLREAGSSVHSGITLISKKDYFIKQGETIKNKQEIWSWITQ